MSTCGRHVGRAPWTLPRQSRCRGNMFSSSRTPYAELLETAKALFPKLTAETLPGEPPKSRNQPLDLSRARVPGPAAAVFLARRTIGLLRRIAQGTRTTEGIRSVARSPIIRRTRRSFQAAIRRSASSTWASVAPACRIFLVDQPSSHLRRLKPTGGMRPQGGHVRQAHQRRGFGVGARYEWSLSPPPSGSLQSTRAAARRQQPTTTPAAAAAVNQH